MESSFLIHSAKGTTWSKKNHKWIRKVNGRYYYADEAKDLEKAKRLDISASAHKKAAEISRKQAEKNNAKNQPFSYTTDDGRTVSVNYSRDLENEAGANIHNFIAGNASGFSELYKESANKKVANRSKGKKLVMGILNRISKDSMSMKKSRVKEKANLYLK